MMDDVCLLGGEGDWPGLFVCMNERLLKEMNGVGDKKKQKKNNMK